MPHSASQVLNVLQCNGVRPFHSAHLVAECGILYTHSGRPLSMSFELFLAVHGWITKLFDHAKIKNVIWHFLKGTYMVTPISVGGSGTKPQHILRLDCIYPCQLIAVGQNSQASSLCRRTG